MINGIKRIMHIVDKRDRQSTPPSLSIENSYEDTALSSQLQVNIDTLKGLSKNSTDINFRHFEAGTSRTKCLIVNISGISDSIIINRDILCPMMSEQAVVRSIDDVSGTILNVHQLEKVAIFSDVMEGVLGGDTVFLIEGSNQALLINTRKFEHRAVQTPETEAMVRGPRTGFTESLQVNTGLVRQIVKTFDLKMECNPIGDRTKTSVCMVYIESIANEEIVADIRQKLADINIDAILESEYIEEIIEGEQMSIFPRVGLTESPSRFASKILEGRVGIIVDGTPFALTVPYLFMEGFQSMEDYYSRPIYASSMRILRYVAFHLTLFLPAFYVALQAFHPAVIPTKLLITIAATQSGLPFPTFVEILLMLLFFEGLREAGVRMPKPVGQAVSIVGALVLGEAAVMAGLVSPLVIIIVAITGIMSFLMPSQFDTVMLLRFPILAMAGMFGLVGVFWSYIFLIIYLASLSSFGAPYLSPISPFEPRDAKDMFVRYRWSRMNTRPSALSAKDSDRQPPEDNK